MYTLTVYALKCPDTRAIRYVGCTNRPLRQRIRVYLSGEAPSRCKRPVSAWVRELHRGGKRPIIFPLAVDVPVCYGYDLEKAYIDLFNHVGFDLLNANSGGLGGYSMFESTRARISATKRADPSVAEALRRNGKRIQRLGAATNKHLSADTVLAIRAASGTLSSISKQFGLSINRVMYIRMRKTYKNVA